MTIQTIPLNQLIPSNANVRKSGAAFGIEELASSIAAHGLLQNLQVRPSAKGRFEVVAGGRRLAALKTLAKRKEIAKDFDVPCHVLDTEDDREISLAENAVRLAMHPADQFTAFHGLVEQGKGIEEVAARFGVSPAVVRQRLKLASVSPRLIDLYRDDDMTLDQLMAFTVSDDPKAQEAAWFEQPDWNRRPSNIRATLTAAQVEADDKRVRFVGLDSYLAAGGGMNRDLFQPEHEGYLTDPALLERLLIERLEREAETLRAQGWKWVIATPSCTAADRQGLRRVFPISVPLSPDQQQLRDRLMAEYDALITEHGEDPDDEIAGELETLWHDIQSIDASASGWRDEDRAIAGVIVSINYQGELDIDAGLVRADDVPKPTLAVVEGGGEPKEPSPLSSRLTESLTAERTAALRAMMIDNQSVALATLCHALALDIFYGPGERQGSCLDLRLVSRDLRRSGEWIEQGGAQVLLNARHADWLKRLPEDAADLFGWLLTQDSPTISSFCPSAPRSASMRFASRTNAPAIRASSMLTKSPTRLDLICRSGGRPPRRTISARCRRPWCWQQLAKGSRAKPPRIWSISRKTS